MATRKTEQAQLHGDWHYDFDERRFDRIPITLPAYPGWVVLPEVAETPEGLELRRVVIEPLDPSDPPQSGITTRMLREVKVGDLLAGARLARRLVERELGPEHGYGDAPTSRVGRRGRPDLYWAQWSARYVAALAESPHPVPALARGHHLSESQVRNILHTCRKRGFLTGSPPGRVGGELTPLAVRVLEEGV